MSKKLFTEKDMSLLSLNPNVKHASEKAITYTDEFNADFMKKYLAENSLTRIFEGCYI